MYTVTDLSLIDVMKHLSSTFNQLSIQSFKYFSSSTQHG